MAIPLFGGTFQHITAILPLVGHAPVLATLMYEFWLAAVNVAEVPWTP
jgi:hypothetical protein